MEKLRNGKILIPCYRIACALLCKGRETSCHSLQRRGSDVPSKGSARLRKDTQRQGDAPFGAATARRGLAKRCNGTAAICGDGQLKRTAARSLATALRRGELPGNGKAEYGNATALRGPE
jgi:hypothetical protein